MKKEYLLLLVLLLIISSFAVYAESISSESEPPPQENPVEVDIATGQEVVEKAPLPSSYNPNQKYTLYNFPILSGESAEDFKKRYKDYFHEEYDVEKWHQMQFNHKRLTLEKERLEGEKEKSIEKQGQVTVADTDVEDLKTIESILNGLQDDEKGFSQLHDKHICEGCIALTKTKAPVKAEEAVVIPPTLQQKKVASVEKTKVVAPIAAPEVVQNPTVESKAKSSSVETPPKPEVQQEPSPNPTPQKQSVVSQIVSFFMNLFS